MTVELHSSDPAKRVYIYLEAGCAGRSGVMLHVLCLTRTPVYFHDVLTGLP